MVTAAGFDATVVDIREHSRKDGYSMWQISFDRTEFEPGSTGVLRATARSGASVEMAILAVEKDEEGVLWHTTEKPLLPGAEVVARVVAS